MTVVPNRGILALGILALGVLALLLGCGGGSGPAPFDGPVTVPHDGTGWPFEDGDAGGGLATRRAAWEALGVLDYRITDQRLACTVPELARSAVVEVRGGVVVSRTDEATGLPVNPAHASWWPDVPGLFDVIEDAIARGADRVEVEWGPDYHHPTRLETDDSTGLADDEQTILAGSFVPL